MPTIQTIYLCALVLPLFSIAVLSWVSNPHLGEGFRGGRRWYRPTIRKSVGECLQARPVESYSGARENIIAGPYHTPLILYVLRSRRRSRRRREGGNVGRGVPSPSPLGVQGRVVSSPSRGPGRSPGRKWILCIF